MKNEYFRIILFFQKYKFTKSHTETAATFTMLIPIKFPALSEFADLIFILWPFAESNCQPLVFQIEAIVYKKSEYILYFSVISSFSLISHIEYSIKYFLSNFFSSQLGLLE